MAFYPLERLMNLYDGYTRAFRIASHDLLLVQDRGRTALLVNRCPHQAAPLTSASVVNGMIRCPAHGMSFDLHSGRSADGCERLLQFLPLAYEGNMVGVNIS